MPHTLPPLNEPAYRRYMRAVGVASRAVGLNLRVQGETQALQNGQIFLFNHFTRFETAVPPYVLFDLTGAIARSVGHHSLFKLNPRISRFLYDVGGVPSDMPGLLPYLAGEILRGRKVVIFPEGGLIKDKRVFDTHGAYAVQSGSGPMRKHHRGAAVLAVYLDIFKAFITDADQRHDTATLAHWQNELGLPSTEALLAAAAKPTRMVPSTLTFFPIRSEANVLTRALDAMAGGLPERAFEEIALETNLLLRPTDLDVCVGAPLPPAWEAARGEMHLWRHALKNIKTLEELFNLELGHAAWLATPLAKRAERRIVTLRDRAARALYGGLTVNVHHLLSQLVEELQGTGRTSIGAEEFDAALLFAAHRLQRQAAAHESLHLHESLKGAESLIGLAQGTHTHARKFLEELRRTRLLKKRDGAYHLSHRLQDVVGSDEIRLEHPVRLHVNEAAPQPAVKLAAMWGLQQAAKLNTPAGRATWAGLVLNMQRDAAAADHTAAGAEALRAGAAALAPFVLKPSRSNGTGVLLLHGLGATPAQMRPLAEDLRALGYTVHAPMLAGHGATPANLRGITHHNWQSSAALGLRLLQAQADLSRTVVVGFSTGALVALQVAQQASVAGVVAVAAPFQLVSPLRHFLAPMRLINALVGATLGRLIPALRQGLMPWYSLGPSYPTEQYAKLPLGAVAHLQKLSRLVRRSLKGLPTPLHLLHGTADSTASLHAAKAVAATLPAATFTTLEGAPHDVVHANTAHSWARIIQAVETLSTAQVKPHEK